jgi:hypothetical protein
MKVASYELLLSVLDADVQQKSSRIVRFINVERMSLWAKVREALSNRCSNEIFLSTFCKGEDATPNIHRLLVNLEKIQSSTILLPLSEHLRINNSTADQVLSQIVNIQLNSIDDGRIRLYIPMYKMNQTLKRLLEIDNRLDECIIFLDDALVDDDYALTILPVSLLNTFSGNNIYGYKKYLSYWEDNPCKPIILHTINAIYYKNNVFIDNVTVLVSSYEILRYHGVIDASVKEEWGREEYWNALLATVGKQNNLSSIFKKTLETDFNVKDLLKKWYKQNDTNRWFTWLWLKL